MKVVVIGGGASGMMACISASKNLSNQVYLFEKNEKLGKKLFITGKGRCNLTNNCDIFDFYKNIVSNQKFMYSSFSTFDNKSTMEFFDNEGLKLKTERGNRVFPYSDKSYDVIDVLKKSINKENVHIKLYSEIKNIHIKDNENDKNYVEVYNINSKKIENYDFDKIIIATGGMSYSSTGSTGDGYKFAKELNINVNECEPSLVPLEVKEIGECIDLNSLNLKNVKIKICDFENKKVYYEDMGEMSFTNNGISGPIVLSSSCYITNKMIKDKNLIFCIDLKPALDEKTLENRILREIDENKNQNLLDLMKKLLPLKLSNVFCQRLNKIFDIDVEKNVSNIKKSERNTIIELLKNFKFHIVGKRGFDEAIITKGGVDVKEINPKTMNSKKYNDVYFCGEVLDVDCLTGGFNLQIAWTTGYVAGLLL